MIWAGPSPGLPCPTPIDILFRVSTLDSYRDAILYLSPASSLVYFRFFAPSHHNHRNTLARTKQKHPIGDTYAVHKLNKSDKQAM